MHWYRPYTALPPRRLNFSRASARRPCFARSRMRLEFSWGSRHAKEQAREGAGTRRSKHAKEQAREGAGTRRSRRAGSLTHARSGAQRNAPAFIETQHRGAQRHARRDAARGPLRCGPAERQRLLQTNSIIQRLLQCHPWPSVRFPRMRHAGAADAVPLTRCR